MRGALLLVAVATLALTASCARSPMLADASDAVSTATDAVPGYVEMPPLYVDAREVYARSIRQAQTEATDLCARKLSCPAVRVRRADMYQRADGTLWTVVRVNACGQERVYARAHGQWNEATARLR